MSSTEVVKKRGRPKKLAAEEAIEPAKKPSTRQKSTKASAASTRRTATATTPTSKPSAVVEKTTTKSIPKHSTTDPSPAKEPPRPVKSTTPPTPSQQQVTAADSPILSKVREISTKPSNPELPSEASKTPPPSPPPPPAAPKTTMPPPTPPPPKIPATKSSPPTAASKVPIAALNSTIVSQLTTRVGARPGAKADAQLPKNYKSAARRVTMALVAMPIALVTSWVLYQRLVLGEEKKHLVMPGLAKVEREAEPAGKGVDGTEGKA